MRIGIQLDFTFGFARQILRGFMAYKQSHGHWRLLVNPYGPTTKSVMTQPIDGVCVVSDRRLGEFVPACIFRQVYVGSLWADAYPVSISPDNQEVGRLAAEFFHRAGFAHVGLFSPLSSPYMKFRVKSFEDTASQLGMKLQMFELGKKKKPGLLDAIPSLDGWVRSLPKPIGIFATNDSCAVELATACDLACIDVPHDVSILGVDNDELLCEAGHVSLSSIDHGTFKMGWEAAAMLSQWIESGKKPVPQKRIMPPQGIIERASTDLVAVREPTLARAMHFIREHVAQNLSVEQVVAASGTNRRSLERRFRDLLGRSIHHEIQMARVDVARAMLGGSDFPLKKIGEQSGFASNSEFSHIFKRYVGTSPSQYRRSHNRGLMAKASQTESN